MGDFKPFIFPLNSDLFFNINIQSYSTLLTWKFTNILLWALLEWRTVLPHEIIFYYFIYHYFKKIRNMPWRLVKSRMKIYNDLESSAVVRCVRRLVPPGFTGRWPKLIAPLCFNFFRWHFSWSGLLPFRSVSEGKRPAIPPRDTV